MRRITALALIMLMAVVIPAGLLGSAYAAPPSQGLAVITSPQSLTTVRGAVVIEGSASHPEFWKYEVHYAPEPNPTNWVLIGSVHETPVVNGRLEVWDTTLVSDGIYSLRLRVARRDGNYDEYYVRQITVANTRPTETPTPAETPTPTITPTPIPPTPTVVIEQPKRITPPASPSPGTTAAVPQATPTPAETPALNLGAFWNAFCLGGKIAFAAFAVLGGLALVRYILRAVARAAVRGLRRRPRARDE
ncbi:MAG: hypothetical protein ACUVWB_12630 [Anaerolineae bacterium]